jgi:hypothetical protein
MINKALWFTAALAISPSAYGEPPVSSVHTTPNGAMTFTWHDTATTNEALTLAHTYCQNYFYIPAGEHCTIDPQNPNASQCDLVNHPAHYTLPECDEIAKRWGTSNARREADAAKQRDMDYARWFITKVSKEKDNK